METSYKSPKFPVYFLPIHTSIPRGYNFILLRISSWKRSNSEPEQVEKHLKIHFQTMPPANLFGWMMKYKINIPLPRFTSFYSFSRNKKKEHKEGIVGQ